MKTLADQPLCNKELQWRESFLLHSTSRVINPTSRKSLAEEL